MNFSVSMSVYKNDNPEHFYTSIKSVYEQTVAPSEIILVVDGPIPEALSKTIETCEAEIPVLKVIRLEKNMGHGIARNTGLDNCTNNIVAIMDSDDIAVPDRFEKQLPYFEQDTNLAVCGGNIAEFIGTPDNVVGLREVPSEDADIKEYIKRRCPFNQMTVMFNKEYVKAVGGYIDWYCDEDYYLWLRLLQKGYSFRNIPEIFVNVRVGKEMYQRRGGVRYFKSEAKLQKYMLDHKIITFPRYFINVAQRLVLQVLMPNKLRGWVFKRFARQKAEA